MRSIRRALARLVAFVTRRPAADDDLHAELQAHLDLETDEFIRRGLAPDEARRQALVASGGVTQAVEAVRSQRGLPWLEDVIGDIRYAARSLRHSPAFTLIVVLTLALGIGANTAIFSVVRGVVLKPLPHRDGDRLVYLRQSHSGPGGENMLFSVPEVADFRAGARSLAGIAEYSPFTFTLRGESDAVRIQAGLVTGNFFEVMGLDPVLGRLTTSADDGAGVPPVMVLTHDYWRSRFGGDSGIVGQQVKLGPSSVTVIGVVEPAPWFPDRVDVLLNMVNSAHHVSAMMVQGRTHRMTEMIARLGPDATLSQARAEAAAVHDRLRAEFSEAYDPGSHYRVTLTPFREALGSRAQLTLWLLIGAAIFSLIIAAANVANLTLMRGVRREPELVARTALGAGAGRLRRMLLVENLLLTTLGAGAGTLLAFGGLGLLVSLVDRYTPRAGDIRVDGVALAFTMGVALVLAIVLALAPSLPREGSLAGMIAAGGRRVTGHRARQRVQRALVVAQVAVSVILLAGAGLLTRTMIELAQVDTGLVTEDVLSMDVPLFDPSAGFAPGADAAARDGYQRILEAVRRFPGVREVAVGSPSPLRRSGVIFDVKAENKVLQPGEAMPRAELRTANPDYFSAAGIPLRAGRPFASTDQAGSAPVVIINQALADRWFRGEDPVGKRVAWSGDVLRFTPISGDWRTIVGVVANTQDGGLDAVPRPAMFMPFEQILPLGGSIVVRSEGNVPGLAAAVTRAVRGVAPAALIENVLTIAQVKDQSVAPRRLNAVLISAFGGLAVLIAAVGIAGVLAFSVNARTSEIGIRMSLGAGRGDVQRMILREGGVLLAAGLALGVAGALLAARVIRGLLFGVTPSDPATFGVVASVMAVIGLAACWIPALRAARIDPAITMRA